MSNTLSVRRVMIQTLNEDGSNDGPPRYGVIAADDFEQSYNDSFESFLELNEEIRETGNILDVIRFSFSDAFDGVDDSEIGTSNFYGKVKTI